jgi:hypothetical protein
MRLYFSKVLFNQSIGLAISALFALIAPSANATSPAEQFDVQINSARDALTGTSGLSSLASSASSPLSDVITQITNTNSALSNASSVVQNKPAPQPPADIALSWFECCRNIIAQLASVEALFKCSSRRDEIYRTLLQRNINVLQSTINVCQANIRSELLVTVIIPVEFPQFLRNENITETDLRNQPNTLVLVNETEMPTTPTLNSLEQIFLVGIYPSFDITACTNLKTIGFFDGGEIDSTQRTQLSNLAKRTQKLENLIVMNWGDSTIAHDAFCLVKSLVKVIIHKATIISEGAFRDCSSLASVLIPDAITIGTENEFWGPFIGCQSLTTVSFPAAQFLGRDAFFFCKQLITASFPSAKTLGLYAFGNCFSLLTITFPANATTFGNTFDNCQGSLQKLHP